jgi:hypothetical protein
MTTAINLYYLLQHSVRYNTQTQVWQPVGVSSLLIDRTDSFSLLIASLATYLLTTFGNYVQNNRLTDANLAALKAALDGGSFNTATATYAWLNSSELTFNINALQFTGNPPVLTSTPAATITDAAVFPMIPGMTVTYNGQGTTFGDGAAPDAYLTTLKQYFAQLSFVGDGSVDSNVQAVTAMDAVPPSSTWFPGVIFADYFNLLAKQIYQELYDVVVKKGIQGSLSDDLGQIDMGNLAGIATRFLQHGLRLPDPADTSVSPTMPLLPLFDLTGQQFDVASDSNNKPILNATITTAAPKFSVTIVGAGIASLPFVINVGPEQSPLWTPTVLDRIKNVPESFMLRQGVSWAKASASKAWQLFGFPDTLQSELRNTNPLSLQLTSTIGSGAPQAASGLEGLLIRFQLAQVPQTNASGQTTYVSHVFQVFGTNEETRDLIKILLNKSDMSTVEVDLLLPTGSGYSTSTADAASTLMLKTNLSSSSQPELAVFAMVESAAESSQAPPALGPNFAPVSNATDFLRLLWECSIVHSGGFYLYVPDLERASFPNPQAKLDVALMVKSSSGQSNSTVTVDAYHNTIIVDTSSGLPPTARIQASVFLTDGITPVTVPQPNYPAGAVAFQAVWKDTDTPPVPANAVADDTAAFAATLYQLLQFQLQAGGKIQASGWSMPLGPNGDATAWEYRRAVPLYRFLTTPPPIPHRYAAIGQTVNVDFQLLDVFGNAYAPTTAQAIPAMAVYNDELIPLDKWPAATAAFAFQAGTGGNAGLTLTVTFQPDQVAQPATALAYYQVIYDQLNDARTSLNVTTALANGPVNLATATGDDIKTALGKFVAAVILYLTDKTNPVPADVDLSGTVSVSYVQQIGEDLFPIWVSIEISRTATDAYVYPDGFLDVVSQVPPLLGGGTADPAALRTWTMNFESAFYNFDGQNALLKVAAGKPPTQISATKSKLGTSAAGAVTSTPGDLWALKWSSTNGVAVSFPNNGDSPAPSDQPVYFAPLPLSTELTFGSVQIFDYDTSGNKVTLPPAPTITFTGIDLDGWARSFLQAFEGLLAPELATKIAQLSGASYTSLMTAKEQLAYAISSNISWILQNQENQSAGNIVAAQDRLREALLASLNADFATSSIVQVPATVSVQNTFETGGGPSSQPPDFFGNPSPMPDPNIDLKQYTVSTAVLPITNGTGYLNFLVGTVDPGGDADLKLAFSYDIGFLDHRFQTSEEQYGYLPSSWLRFVVSDTDPNNTTPPALDVAMGTLDIPIPLRAYPLPPRLISQIAQTTNPTPTTIPQALEWNYNLQLARPLIAQDDLHLTILGNGQTLNRTVGTEQGTNLFNALASFQDFQTRYFLQAIPAILANTSPAANWLGDIVSLVQAVATAWQPQAEEETVTTDAPSTTSPAPFEWAFILQVEHETEAPNTLILTWNGDPAVTFSWPTMYIPPAVAGEPITEVSGVPVPGSTPPQCTYTLLPAEPPVEVINIVWSALSVITVQSLSAAAWIERNETLIEGQPTNPEFVYSTQTVSFQDPLVPLLQVPTRLLIANTKSPVDAVNQLVTQIMQPLTPTSQVGWSLEAGYSFVLVASTPGQLPTPGELATRLPVFLVKTAITTASSAPAPPPIVQTMQDFESALVAALNTWHANFHPSDSNASLLFEVTLFASGTQQPLARLLDIEIPISGASWWAS